jgi:hypothetical protein
MIFFLLLIAVVAMSVECRSEAWSAFYGFVMLISIALALLVGLLQLL